MGLVPGRNLVFKFNLTERLTKTLKVYVKKLVGVVLFFQF